MKETTNRNDSKSEPVLGEAAIQAKEGKLTDEQQKIIEKYDKEATVQPSGYSIGVLAFFWFCIAVSLYHFVTSYFGTPVVLKHRSLHVAMMLIIGFIMYPSGKKDGKKKMMWLDWTLIAFAVVVPLYMWIEFLGVVDRAGRPNNADVWVASILVILVLEAARRATGWALPSLSMIFILYSLTGPRGIFNISLPAFGHRGYTWEQFSNHLFANTEGIFGTSVDVAASYIFLFILFGAVMGKCGMGIFFTDVAMALAGHTKGGPAKVSVIASALLGSINGSAIANVVTTGVFTIPLMKKMGYSKEFAGAVEASSSVGGQILPPVMGAAAFIMAEILRVPYVEIMKHALIPALLYYVGVIIQVHLRAGKLNLVGLPKDQLPKLGPVMMDKWHLIIPIFVLVYLLLFTSFTVLFSAVMAIVSTIVISSLRKSTRMSLKAMCEAFAEGARATAPVAIACACVGIIVGSISRTGFGINMADTIISLGSKNLLFTLFFTMLSCMVLGMGVPSIPAYIITATIGASALAKLGIPGISAHMFAFYYAMFANLTPPVALACFAAAAISAGDPIKTSFAAVKLAIAGFIVPFMFIYSPQLLLIDTTLMEGIRVVIGACLGVFLFAVAAEGYLFTKVHFVLRLIAFIGALCLIDSGITSSLIGGVVLVGLVMIQYTLEKRETTV